MSISNLFTEQHKPTQTLNVSEITCDKLNIVDASGCGTQQLTVPIYNALPAPVQGGTVSYFDGLTHEMYYSDGSTWSKVSNQGGGASPGGDWTINIDTLVNLQGTPAFVNTPQWSQSGNNVICSAQVYSLSQPFGSPGASSFEFDLPVVPKLADAPLGNVTIRDANTGNYHTGSLSVVGGRGKMSCNIADGSAVAWSTFVSLAYTADY